MKNLLTAITTKHAGSLLSADVAGRIYFGQADADADYPCVVWFIVNGSNLDTFKNKVDDVLVQFSLFSTSLTGIADMHAHLIAMFDDCSLTVTGSTCISFINQGKPQTMTDKIFTDQGETTVYHWAQDYALILEKS